MRDCGRGGCLRDLHSSPPRVPTRRAGPGLSSSHVPQPPPPTAAAAVYLGPQPLCLRLPPLCTYGLQPLCTCINLAFYLAFTCDMHVPTACTHGMFPTVASATRCPTLTLTCGMFPRYSTHGRQGNSVPMAIGGLDVISVAQTGSGKTLAFMLPIMYKLLEAGPGGGSQGGGRNSQVRAPAPDILPARHLR